MTELEDAQQNLEEALHAIDKKEYFERFENPKRFVEVNFPVEMDSGEKKVFRGSRSLHSDIRGPGKVESAFPKMFPRKRSKPFPSGCH